MTLHEDLIHAIMADDAERVRELIATDPALATADPEISPLLLALYRGRRESVDALLTAHPPLNAHEAAALGATGVLRGHLDAQPELVSGFADDGFTLLHRAAWFGHLDASTLLLDRGADAGAVSRNDAEQTPLHAAVQQRHGELAELLLARGAPPNAAQAGGLTPLHLAAYLGDEEMSVMLIECGASATVEADDGRTPGDIAYLHEHDMLATLLEVVAGGSSSA